MGGCLKEFHCIAQNAAKFVDLLYVKYIFFYQKLNKINLHDNLQIKM